jgi:isopentenyl-diphosphate Delta-isomerase
MEVILVDEHDVAYGSMEKMEAHQKAMLHRAFSIFIFNGKGELLLQKRALEKYHSGGLWTNTCCGHPLANQLTLEAAITRLQEEMGFTTTIEKAFDFIYKTSFENGLTEHEFDHVFIGNYDGDIIPNPSEVSNYKFLPIEEIKKEFMLNPAHYSAWFAIAFPKVEAYLNSTFKK